MYFKSLQVLRGWAALAVALYHLGHYADTIGANPNSIFRHFDARFGYGAWFFFVLSGFLMSYLIDTGYRRFLPRRMLRIYPIFWLAVVAVIFVKVLIFGSIDMPGLWKAMLLFPFGPSVAYPLGVEWTLIYEVFFYVVCAPFADDRLRHTFIYFLIAWFVLLLVAYAAFDIEITWFAGANMLLPAAIHLPFSMMNVLFIAGGLGYYVYRRLSHLRMVYIPMLILAPFVFTLADRPLAEYLLQIPSTYASYLDYTLLRLPLLGLSFALVVVGVCIRERSGTHATKQGLSERFGDYSYALYLVHVPTITTILFLAQWKVQRPVGDWICVVALAAALLAGWYGGKVDVWLHTYFKHAVGIRPLFDTAVELPARAAVSDAASFAPMADTVGYS